MLRLVIYLFGIAVIATGLSWLADRPGLIVFNWEGYEGEISVFHTVVGLAFLIGVAILLWSLVRAVWTSPATIGNYFFRRRQNRGLEALSSGIIAIGAGDGPSAMRYAVQARKTLPNEPLTHLLRAQAAQLAGDKTTTRRIFEAMLAQPDTEQLGLRGLFLEAQREGEREAARQFAERALNLNPKLSWSADALFELQCKASDWQGALQTLASAKKHGHLDKAVADRRRAVLLTAQAQAAEERDPDRALALALEAHNLAPALVPAAAISGRLLASRGNTAKAAKVLQKTWLKSPHPDLASAYAYARIGDSPMDRLDRVRQLASLQQNSIESAIAIARAAIESKNFEAARSTLEPLLDERLTQRVATLMARIEAEEKGDAGRVREWLARAANAQRDPAWTADGVISEEWAPVSPVTGQLDAFQWRIPVEALESADSGLLTDKLDELAALGAPLEAIEAKPIGAAAAPSDHLDRSGREDSKPSVAAAEKPGTSDDQSATKAKPAKAPAAAVVPGASDEARSNAAGPVVVSGGGVATGSADVSATKAETGSVPAPASQSTPAPLSAPAPKAVASPAAQPTAAVAAVAAPVDSAKEAATSPQMVSAPMPAEKTPAPVAVVVSTDKIKEKAAAKDGAKEASKEPSKEPVTEATKEAAPAPISTGAGTAVALPGKVEAERKATGGAKDDQAKIFVSPRAPDDPGPEAGVEDIEPVMPRYGTNR